LEQAQAVVSMYQEQFRESMKCLATGLEECLAVLRFPGLHRRILLAHIRCWRDKVITTGRRLFFWPTPRKQQAWERFDMASPSEGSFDWVTSVARSLDGGMNLIWGRCSGDPPNAVFKGDGL
jgi:hypothetical protein